VHHTGHRMGRQVGAGGLAERLPQTSRCLLATSSAPTFRGGRVRATMSGVAAAARKSAQDKQSNDVKTLRNRSKIFTNRHKRCNLLIYTDSATHPHRQLIKHTFGPQLHQHHEELQAVIRQVVELQLLAEEQPGVLPCAPLPAAVWAVFAPVLLAAGLLDDDAVERGNSILQQCE
jgi:hypothetical protein